ncbi:RNA 2',3'-cyclic phosphodiesterase [Virgibacillus salarius]|uniref:RNA 2',3'-cyclic phosphodiesterase n=1 Tax=Virgibacillus salarius TaxID=447199 RepID=UPI0024933F00|nr:RNA 2',3'-cyclic phosphodiesterase [Virgibacillus salarius]WBX78861.1 RNA 2',3'-cyclic phosphodiesterase [Virgibacillus salarius]
MTEQPHYFIAIPLSTHLQNYFSMLQENLMEQLSYKQWPHRQDLHVTLKFLGPVADKKLQALIQVLEELHSFQAFNTQVGGVGAFGLKTQPRVLYADVELTDRLKKLQEQVEKAVEQIGFSKEKRDFVPHITLAKKWTGSTGMAKTLATVKATYTEKQPFLIDKIGLFRIYPKEMPKYKIVASFNGIGGEDSGSIN